MFLDEKPTFIQHIDKALCKVNKAITVVKSNTLPRKPLFTIYKVF